MSITAKRNAILPASITRLRILLAFQVDTEVALFGRCRVVPVEVRLAVIAVENMGPFSKFVETLDRACLCDVDYAERSTYEALHTRALFIVSFDDLELPCSGQTCLS